MSLHDYCKLLLTYSMVPFGLLFILTLLSNFVKNNNMINVFLVLCSGICMGMVGSAIIGAGY